MKKIKFLLSIGYSGADHSDVMEYADDASDETINADYDQWCQNYMDGGWWVVEDEDE